MNATGAAALCEAYALQSAPDGARSSSAAGETGASATQATEQQSSSQQDGAAGGPADLSAAQQHSQVSPPTTEPQNAPEMTTTDTAPTLRVRSNLVLVRVVVRDKRGHAVTGLSKEDFRLFDEKAEQFISQFTVQAAPKAAAEIGTASAAKAEGKATASEFPERYVGLYFDDLHIGMQDLLPMREAALKYVQTGLGPADRAGVFTSSGELQQDFTSDHEKIAEAIRKLQPRSLYTAPTAMCPDIGAYQAWMITEMHDAMSGQVAAEEILNCFYNNDTSKLPQAEAMAQGYAVGAWNSRIMKRRMPCAGWTGWSAE